MRHMLTRFVYVFAVALLVNSGQSHGGTIVSNLSDPVNGAGTIYASGPPQTYAQEFTTGNQSAELGTVIVPLGGAVGSFTASAELVADNGGVPGGTVLATFTIPTIGTSFSDLTLTPNVNALLSANTDYWLVLSATGTGETTSYKWQYTNTTDPSLPNYAYSHNNGSSWTIGAGGPFLIEVDSVPEPPSLVLIALGVPAAVYGFVLKRKTGPAPQASR